MAKLHTIDLFAGCGGLMDGFEQSGGFDTLACVEWEKVPCKNLVARLKTRWGHENADKEVLCFDIQRTEELFQGFSDPVYGVSKGLDHIVGSRKIDVIIGGPPCQAYSLAGRIRDEKGMKDDYRNYLFESYLKVVKRYQPNFFLFENVVGLLSATPGGEPIVNRIQAAFRDAGYVVIGDFKKAEFSLPDYGVPQNRRRIIILGVRKESFPNAERIVDDFYSNIMPAKKCCRKTVSQAIGDLPKYIPQIEDGKVLYRLQGNVEIPNHTPRHHSARDLKVFKLLTEDIESGRNEYISIPKLKELYTQTTGRKSNIHKYYVLRKNQQSNTIPAHLYKDGFRHIHPDSIQCRTLTVREAARLQTFDDDYVFSGSMGDQYKMIGNAVPPAFAKILGEAIVEVYEKHCPEKLPSDFQVNRIEVSRCDRTQYKQMLLAVERKKAKMSAREKASGLKGKTYSKAAKPKKSGVAKNSKAKKTGKK